LSKGVVVAYIESFMHIVMVYYIMCIWSSTV